MCFRASASLSSVKCILEEKMIVLNKQCTIPCGALFHIGQAPPPTHTHMQQKRTANQELILQVICPLHPDTDCLQSG